MPRYIALMKLTEQGIKDIKNAPQRLEQAIAGMEAAGGKLIDFYTVMGEYDYIAVSEFPSDEIGMTFLLTLGSQGNVRTTTLKAWDAQQLGEFIKNMP
ncbi:MAG: GYD domain-containing protein [Dehalococcoidales bacterium]|nr:MAG: GYD domain-containing protein [Dehalococcoidales bacterium]